MMKLILDQGLPRSAARLLQERELDTVHVGDIGMSTASDTEILKMAESNGRVVVTLDADFHAILAVNGFSSPSVIRIRIEGLDGHSLCTLICMVLDKCADDLSKGAMISVQRDRIGIRHLPISK